MGLPYRFLPCPPVVCLCLAFENKTVLITLPISYDNILECCEHTCSTRVHQAQSSIIIGFLKVVPLRKPEKSGNNVNKTKRKSEHKLSKMVIANEFSLCNELPSVHWFVLYL